VDFLWGEKQASRRLSKLCFFHAGLKRPARQVIALTSLDVGCGLKMMFDARFHEWDARREKQ